MAAPTAPIRGVDCYTYRNTGSHSSPVLDVMPNVMGVKISQSYGESEIPSRAGQGDMMTEPTMRRRSAAWRMMYDPADTDFTTLQTAFENRTAIQFYFLDQISSTAGSAGPRFFAKIFKFDLDQDNDTIYGVDVEVKRCYDTNASGIYTTS